MRTTTTIDKAGRLVLPKAIREALCVGAGDTVEIECDHNRAVLSPVRVRPALQKEKGVWVYRSGSPVNASIPELIDRQRERRTQELIGNQE